VQIQIANWRWIMLPPREKICFRKIAERWRGKLAVAGLLALLGGARAVFGAEPETTCEATAIASIAPPRTWIEAAHADEAGSCIINGRVITHSPGLPDGSARFVLTLPRNWSRRFVFWGVGGYGGDLGPAVNKTDLTTALGRGYATGVTDTGHTASPSKVVDASFALEKAGTPNRAAKADYYFRATHDVTLALKKLTKTYYGLPIRYSYFDGCSNGGRQAMVEAEQYPDDFDGIISGDPALDLRLELSDIRVHKSYLDHPQSRLWGKDLSLVDRYVLDQCDEIDGVKDRIIQDPGKCHPDFSALICRAGRTEDCLTPGQVNTLEAFTSPTLDEQGKEVYPGFPVGYYMQTRAQQWQFGTDDLPTPPTHHSWPDGTGPYEYQFDDETLKYIVVQNPSADFMSYPVGDSQIVPANLLKTYDRAVQEGNARDPWKLVRFLRKNGKLIMFHGYADTSISPFGSIAFYRDLLKVGKQLSIAPENNVALFMVPGMGHCSGGTTPSVFDSLATLQDWIEKGTFPRQMIAVSADDPQYSMPLCPYPQTVKLMGPSPRKASDWVCVTPSSP
jgi:pimeloyl-ACP methyl ester carboxylesterase